MIMPSAPVPTIAYPLPISLPVSAKTVNEPGHIISLFMLVKSFVSLFIIFNLSTETAPASLDPVNSGSNL